LRNPAVAVRIRGETGWLLVDTGANRNMLDTEAATRLGFPVLHTIHGTDYYGRPVPTQELGPVEVELGAWRHTYLGVNSSPRPKQWRQLHLIGTVSPQRLLDTGVTLVDLSRLELILVPHPAEPLDRWLAARYPERRFESFPRLGRPEALATIVTGALLPHPPGPILLDTGALDTDFSDAVTRVAPEPAVVAIGSHRLAVRKLSLRPFAPSEGLDGIVGVDSLRTLVLAFPAGRNEIWIGF
jgi:hypothetical protein